MQQYTISFSFFLSKLIFIFIILKVIYQLSHQKQEREMNKVSQSQKALRHAWIIGPQTGPKGGGGIFWKIIYDDQYKQFPKDQYEKLQ